MNSLFEFFTRVFGWRRDAMGKRLRPADVVFFTLLLALAISGPYMPAVKISVMWIALAIVMILFLTYRVSEANRAAWCSD
jgi:hypothetical protein